MISKEKTDVFIAGMFGGLGQEVTKALVNDKRYAIMPLTNELKSVDIDIPDLEKVVPFTDRDIFDNFDILIKKYGKFVVIDCTTRPQWKSAELFAESFSLPTLILGTGGMGDKENEDKLKEMAKRRIAGISNDFLVDLVTNAAAPLNVLLRALEEMPKILPGAYTGMEGKVEDSHQWKKKTAPGYAKRMRDLFRKSGAIIPSKGTFVDGVDSIRDPEIQMKEWGVPKEYINGHGFHDIEFKSSNGNMRIKIRTEILGREPYAEGVRDVFLPLIIDQYQNETTGLYTI